MATPAPEFMKFSQDAVFGDAALELKLLNYIIEFLIKSLDGDSSREVYNISGVIHSCVAAERGVHQVCCLMRGY
jgi:hypothetical protein